MGFFGPRKRVRRTRGIGNIHAPRDATCASAHTRWNRGGRGTWAPSCTPSRPFSCSAPWSTVRLGRRNALSSHRPHTRATLPTWPHAGCRIPVALNTSAPARAAPCNVSINPRPLTVDWARVELVWLGLAWVGIGPGPMFIVLTRVLDSAHVQTQLGPPTYDRR